MGSDTGVSCYTGERAIWNGPLKEEERTGVGQPPTRARHHFTSLGSALREKLQRIAMELCAEGGDPSHPAHPSGPHCIPRAKISWDELGRDEDGDPVTGGVTDERGLSESTPSDTLQHRRAGGKG